MVWPSFTRPRCWYFVVRHLRQSVDEVAIRSHHIRTAMVCLPRHRKMCRYLISEHHQRMSWYLVPECLDWYRRLRKTVVWGVTTWRRSSLPDRPRGRQRVRRWVLAWPSPHWGPQMSSGLPRSRSPAPREEGGRLPPWTRARFWTKAWLSPGLWRVPSDRLEPQDSVGVGTSSWRRCLTVCLDSSRPTRREDGERRTWMRRCRWRSLVWTHDTASPVHRQLRRRQRRQSRDRRRTSHGLALSGNRQHRSLVE